MTVCIAARSSDNFIFALADRMVTAGDVQFEAPASKIFAITSSIYALTSDEDSALHTEILIDLLERVAKLIHENPQDWLEVKFIADLYLKCRNELKRKMAERALLLPLGLNSETFTTAQQGMNSDFITGLANQIINYNMPQLSVIFCGIDKLGPHIYVVHDNEIGCYDGIGFASIGIGASHANSQFMLHRHTPSSSTADTVFLTYLAKKRAEIAPGVGTETDTLVLTSLGQGTPWNDDLLMKLDDEYKKMIEMESSAQQAAKKEMGTYVKKLQDDATAAEAAAEAPTQESDRFIDEGDTAGKR